MGNPDLIKEEYQIRQKASVRSTDSEKSINLSKSSLLLRRGQKSMLEIMPVS